MNRKVWLVVFMVCWALTGRAQVTTGTISGTVSDATGAVMPGVRMVAQNEDTGITRTVTSDAAGRYTAPQLSLGNYRVTASIEGFQTEVRRGILLTVGREAVVNMQLTVGAVAQIVEVIGEAPLVQTTEATVGYLISERTVQNLPLEGRDLAGLVLLSPGVSEAVNASRTGSAFQGWGRRISIGGARAQDSAYLLDGTYINDMNHHIPSGPSGALLGVETVREFEVLTSSFGAQYGRTMGGVLNAVSRSGTNEFHGSIYNFLRNSAMDARNFFDRDPSNPTVRSDPPPFRRNQFGAAGGGPIQKDKAFFFVAYEALRQRLSETLNRTVPDVNARLGILPTGTVAVAARVRPFLDLWPLPTPGGANFGAGTAEYIFTSSQPTRDDFGQGRVDWQISDNDSLFVRFTASNSDQANQESYPGFLHLPHMATRLLTIGETHIFSPTLLLTARAGFSRVFPGDDAVRPKVPAHLESVPGEGPPDLSPGSGISGISGYGTPGDYFITNRFEYKGDINHAVGAHALKYGALLERMQFNQNLPNRMFGTWTWGSLTTFLTGATPTTYRGTPRHLGDAFSDTRQWFWGFYFQDDWKVNSKLTLNLGLRYEPYTVPVERNGRLRSFWNQRNLMDQKLTPGDPLWIGKSKKDFGPRFGFAYSPFASGKTAVRGGFGILYLPNDPNVYRNMTGRNVVANPELTFTVTPAIDRFPDALATIAAFRTDKLGTNVAMQYDGFKTPRSLRYNVDVQQQIGAANMVALGYTGARGINHTSFSDYNMPNTVYDGTSLTFPVGAERFNPVFEQIAYTTSNSNSWYNAMTFSFAQRATAGLSTQVAYTWAKSQSISDTAARAEYSGGGAATLIDAHQPHVSKSLSGYHIGHAFNFNYTYEVPFGRGMTGVAGRVLKGWQITGIVRAQSGQPFTLSRTVPTAIAGLTASGVRPNRDLSVPNDKITAGTTAGCTGVAAGQKLGTPDRYFDPCAYSVPTTRQLGNVGVNTLLSPTWLTWNSGLTKDTTITERWRLQFRAEVFNVANRANLSNPASGLFTAGGARVATAARINGTSSANRQMQLSLKLLF